MTSLPLPLPPDDPRQVRARKAARTKIAHTGLWEAREWQLVDDILAAYFSALQTEGVVLVESDGELDSLCCELATLIGPGEAPRGVSRASYWISRVAQALGEAEAVAAPPCKECEGTGKASPLSLCPRCNGSGLARMVALDDVVEFIADGDFKAGNKLMAAAVEHRFSGTGEEPHG